MSRKGELKESRKVKLLKLLQELTQLLVRHVPGREADTAEIRELLIAALKDGRKSGGKGRHERVFTEAKAMAINDPHKND